MLGHDRFGRQAEGFVPIRNDVRVRHQLNNPQDEPGTHGPADADGPPSAYEKSLLGAVDKFLENPSLALYKIKTNGYKFSWALVPLSLPFMWLMFLGRRDVRMYDHAIFVTYSITFVMMLLIVMSLLDWAGVSALVLTPVQQVVVPVHMYRHLRGAYGLSRAAALGRLVLLLFSAALVLLIFVTGLVLIGVLG